MKIYTARYSNKTLADREMLKVGFTQGYPRFPLGYVVTANLINLAPTRAIWPLSPEDFEVAYTEHLERIGFEKVAKQLEGLSEVNGGKDIILLCYEDLRKADQYCHRTTFARWWQSMTGETVSELGEAHHHQIAGPPPPVQGEMW